MRAWGVSERQLGAATTAGAGAAVDGVLGLAERLLEQTAELARRLRAALAADLEHTIDAALGSRRQARREEGEHEEDYAHDDDRSDDHDAPFVVAVRRPGHADRSYPCRRGSVLWSMGSMGSIGSDPVEG